MAANSPTRKRSATAFTNPDLLSFPDRHLEPRSANISTLPSGLRADRHRPFGLRRRFSLSKTSTTPVMAAPQAMQPSLPSFMSVFEVDSNMSGMPEDAEGGIQTQLEPAPFANRTVPVMTGRHPFETSHQHHDSTSTSASASADSSPTTTISTVDSSSITDTSPGSSPESPVSILPLSSFSSRRCGIIPSTEDLSVCSPTSPPPGYNRPLSPGRKARNTKNLSLNMVAPTRNAPPPPPLQINTTTFGDRSLPLTAPSSPSFIVPPKPPKRKPSGLTIQPPGTGNLLERGNKGLRIVPPTPSNRRPALLRHHQSSPSLSLFSPTMEARGGMQLPPFSSQRAAKLFHPPRQTQFLPCPESPNFTDSASEQLSPAKSLRLDQLEEDIEPPLSQEVKSPAYPNGPVCIYDPNVYLYLEPNEKEASQFDVVLNVAREVKNPFKVAAERREREEKERLAEVKDAEPKDVDVPVPDTASTAATFQAATTLESVHNQTPTTLSPTTPKAAEPPSEPEYVYIPWDHNTNIVDDLLRLVELIDDRVKQGKRVLVHCQCGVSRSASLIIAYGIYKNPSLSVQEAYDAVKERSRWIGPNMSLIYQLSEFRNLLVRKNGMVQPGGYRGWRTGCGSKSLIANGRANTVSSGSPTTRPSLLPDSFIEPHPEPPQTAPLPADRDRLSPMDIRSPLSPPQLVCVDKLGDVTPGPSSAPPAFSFIPVAGSVEAHGGSWASGLEQHGYVLPQLPPVAASVDYSRGCMLQREVKAVDPIIPRDTPPTPTLLSPRQAEFMMPFASGRVAEAASSFGFSIGLQGPAFFADPRSPVQRGEAPIVRSIFDVL